MKWTAFTAALFLFCALTLFPSSASAQTGIPARKAAEIVKSKFSLPENVKEFKSSYVEWEGRGRWDLRWVGSDENLYAGVDAVSGDIVHFRRHTVTKPDEKTSLLPAVTRENALAEAREFLRKAVPVKYGELRLAEREVSAVRYDRDYEFFFERVVNGIAYLRDGASVRVSGKTGEVEYYDLRWDYKAEFPNAEKAISPEKAEQIFMDSGVLELMYYLPVYQYKENGERPKIMLVYGVRNPRSVLVNALTGEFTDDLVYHGFDLYEYGGMGSPERLKELSPLEEKEVEVIGELLSKEKAMEAALKYFDLPEGYRLDSARLYEDYREQNKRIWSFNWNPEDTEKIKGHVSAAVDAKTGELLSFSKWLYSPDEGDKELKYSLAQAREIGEKFIKKVQPRKAEEIRYHEEARGPKPVSEEEQRYASFSYTRLVNGIPFYDDGFTVTVDRSTGEVTAYSMKWADFHFPDPKGIVGALDAFTTLTKINKLKMDYLKASRPSEKVMDGRVSVGLYYHFSRYEPCIVDAFTGKVLTNEGEEYKVRGKVQFSDVTGHPYRDDINLLLSMGIIEGAGERFYPDRSTTNAEFIKMLVLANGWPAGEGDKIKSLEGKWYGPYYQTAVFRGLIDRDSLPEPNKEITRIFCARLMLKAMDLDKVAELSGIFNVPAADVGEIADEDAGYAAIALKMNLIVAVNNKFMPWGQITRGEAAGIIVRYMRTATR